MMHRNGALGRGAFVLILLTHASVMPFAGTGVWPVCVAGDATAASSDFAKIDQEAEMCVRASDAVALYAGFLAQADLPPDVRRQAQKKLEIWQDRERKGLRRAGNAWVTAEDLAARSTAFIKAGLTFRKLGNKKFARAEMQKASDLDRTSGTAEMWLGIFDVYDDEYLAAMRHFQEAARREPENAEAFSNAAVSGFRSGRTTRVADDFRCAMERAGMGVATGVAENMSLILALHTGQALDIRLSVYKSMPTPHLEGLKKVYSEWLKDASVDLESLEGFTWYLPALPPGFEGPKFEVGEVGRAIPPTRSGGTGFVIAPQFVITNAHVVEGADKVTIMTPAKLKKKAGERPPQSPGEGADEAAGLVAEILFQDPAADLALLKCPELDLPSLKMRLKVPRRGTELLSLGFPSFFDLGASIKSTGGRVVSEAQPQPRGRVKSIFYHDATINRGNSGGPLVDDTAAVIGVNVAFLVAGGIVDNAMYQGVPVEEVWKLLEACGHEIPAAEADSSASMKWPDVDEIVSKSTVLVLVEKRGSVRK